MFNVNNVERLNIYQVYNYSVAVRVRIRLSYSLQRYIHTMTSAPLATCHLLFLLLLNNYEGSGRKYIAYRFK